MWFAHKIRRYPSIIITILWFHWLHLTIYLNYLIDFDDVVNIKITF